MTSKADLVTNIERMLFEERLKCKKIAQPARTTHRPRRLLSERMRFALKPYG